MKKMLVVLMFVIVMVMPTMYVAAKEIATLPNFDVYFNGNKVESEFREYPLLVYKDITYFPMTYFDSRHLGLATEWNDATHTLDIHKKENFGASLRDYTREQKNKRIQEVKICNFNITIFGNPINNSTEEYPLITFRDVTYFPLTWRYAYEMFSWHYEFTHKNGLCIESDVKLKNVKLPYLDGVFACDENYYYYEGYKDGKQSIYRADINNPENYTTIYDFLHNGHYNGGKCLVSVIFDMGNIYFKYHAGSGLMGSFHYVKIASDGTAVEEAPKNYTHFAFANPTYYKETEDMSLVVKHDFYDAPSKFYYTIDGVEHEAQMHPDKPHVKAYQDGKNASSSVNDLDLIQIIDKSIYFVGKNSTVKTDSALYRIDTQTGKTEKLLENVGAFLIYYGLGKESYIWGYATTAEDMSYNVIFDRNGVLYCYNIDKGVETEISGTSKGKLITGFGGRIVAQQNLETKEDTITIFGVPHGTSFYNKKYLSTKNGAKMYLCGGNLIYQITSELPDDEIRLAVIRNGSGGDLRSSDVAKHVYVNDNTILYSLFDDSETIVRIDSYQQD